MGDDEVGRSPELDRVRQLLFPDLPAEQGWERIEEAFKGAHDPERVEAIERLAESDLDDELIAILRRLRRGS
jgi:hypothetical protein